MREKELTENREQELLDWKERQLQLRKKYSFTPAGFAGESEEYEAAQALKKARKEYENRKCHVFLTAYEPKEEKFAGRKTYLEKIEKAVGEGTGPVVLYGIGGIGKTSLARAFVRRIQRSGNPFDAVLFLSYNGSMEALICDDSQLSISNLFYSKDKYGSKTEYFRKKMEALQEMMAASRLLLVIDDCNTEKDRKMEEVFSLPCHILVTTRMNPEAWQQGLFSGQEKEEKKPVLTGIEVKEFETEDEWEEFIRIYQEHSFSSEEQEEIRRYRSRVHGHTLLMMFKIRGIDVGEKETFAGDEVEEFAEDLFRRFKLTRLEKQALCELSIMPVQGIEETLYYQLSRVSKRSVGKLADRLLIRRADGWISIHPIIASAARRVFHPGQKTCRILVEQMRGLAFNAWNQTYMENQRLVPYVSALLEACPVPLYWQYREYDAMITLLWVQGYFEEAQHYCKILLKTIEEHYGLNHQVTVDMTLRLAATYYNAMDFEEAHHWYVEAYKRMKNSEPFDFRYNFVCCSVCHKLSREYRYKGDFEEALRLNGQELAYLELYDDQGRENEDIQAVAHCYALLHRAQILWDMGRCEEAWKIGKEARDEIAACEDGTRVYDVSEYDRFLIKAMIKREAYEDAEALAESLVERTEKFRHRFSKESLSAREHLADVWCAKGKKEKALEAYGSILEILREEFPYQTTWMLRIKEKKGACRF